METGPYATVLARPAPCAPAAPGERTPAPPADRAHRHVAHGSPTHSLASTGGTEEAAAFGFFSARRVLLVRKQAVMHQNGETFSCLPSNAAPGRAVITTEQPIDLQPPVLPWRLIQS